MRSVAVAIVLLGVALSVGLALSGGLDVTGAVILTLLVAMGGLAIAVVARSRTDEVKPAECPSCGGLVSPNAPYCKHCGADLTA